MTNKETIESYNHYAPKWAERKKTGGNPFHEYLNPQMFERVPNLAGKTVVCVGCGAGEECEFFYKSGVKKIVGTDISIGLLSLAKKNYPYLTFCNMDMENLTFADGSIDFVFSNLAFHYIESWHSILASVNRILKPGGKLLFSTHHPVKWGAMFEKNEEERTHIMGYKRNTKTGEFEIFGDYLNTRLVDDTWFGDFHVKYYHRSLAAMMHDVLNSGMTLVDFDEPKPIKEAQIEDPSFYEIHQKIPTFIIFELEKPRL